MVSSTPITSWASQQKRQRANSTSRDAALRVTASVVNLAYLELAWALKRPLPLLYKYKTEQMILGLHEVQLELEVPLPEVSLL